jgi:class 3 adenylate cyclase
MVRKTVTVVFADLVGSTALGERTDPEVLQGLMQRFHAQLRGILERHGGTVEKFIGDAAMAVFGVPQAHEDDALRAVRAATEIRERVAGLGMEVRIGVNTGEVVTGEGETLVAGDAVNVAARLEQAAQRGEVLIGETTERLVRAAVSAEPVEPLPLRGKAQPVAAFRLLEVAADIPAFARPIAARFVGRASAGLPSTANAIARVSSVSNGSRMRLGELASSLSNAVFGARQEVLESPWGHYSSQGLVFSVLGDCARAKLCPDPTSGLARLV